MKIRSGFVSNSSSSSFVVEARFTTAQVAKIMMWEIMSGRDEADDWDFPYRFKEALDWLEENLDYDEPLFFPWSINESTYIWRDNMIDILVKTCHNHDWSVLAPAYPYDVDYPPDDVEFLHLDTMIKKKGFHYED